MDPKSMSTRFPHFEKNKIFLKNLNKNFKIFLKKYLQAGNRTGDPWHCNPLSYLWTILGLLKIIENIAYLYQTFVRKKACQSTEKGLSI